MELEIKIFLSEEEIAKQVAGEIKFLVDGNAGSGRQTFISLSGGNTPKVLYKLLSDVPFNTSINWNSLHLFWGDERCVPPDNEQSNYGMTKKILLDKITIPPENIHRIIGEDKPEREIERYTVEIKKIVPAAGELPRFDLVLLGLGQDGHTASLFPRKKLKNVADKIAGVAIHPKTGQKRISMTYEILNNSSKIIFIATGKKKAGIIFRILSEKDSKKKYPAAKIEAVEVLKWYFDKGAASRIKMP